MSTVAGASAMSMSSLYAMLGLAMPSGAAATGAGSTIELAMLSASNETASAEIGALVSGLSGGSAPSTGAADLTSALLGLANLDPTVELERLQGAVGGQLADAASSAT